MFERFFGAKEDKIIGKTDYDFVDRELADSFTENDRIAMHADKPTINEEWITFADDGHLAYLETIKSPMYDADKNLIGILGIGRDITQRKRFETELIQAKEDAEESDRLKSAFLTNMSHEIRTPMNGILGFAELLKEPMLTIEEKNEYIDIIEKSGIRLLNLINDILSISKIESGQSEIINSKININELIKEICAFFRPEAAQKGIILRFIKHLPYNEAVIKTDSNKVSAILTNLIKNAIKFTNTGSIEIGYTNKDSLLEFFVKDTGIGVRPEQKEMIFERFRQGSESLIRNYEGAGLGLSISKGYAEMLGGKIWVETNQDTPISDELTENRGSIFFFTIPYFPVIEENIPVKEIFPYIAIEKQYENLKILIVEDDKVSELLISINAGKIAKDLKRVNTGPEAVEFCHIHPDIDLIIMDIKLPGMDGFEATRQIRKFNKDVIIIAQTAFGLSGAREKAIDAGCNEFIEKPVKFAQLNNLIKKLFNK
jgi:PAS domain S-box-containing protein